MASQQTGGRKSAPVCGSISCALYRHDMKAVKDFSWRSAYRVVNLCVMRGTENWLARYFYFERVKKWNSLTECTEEFVMKYTR